MRRWLRLGIVACWPLLIAIGAYWYCAIQESACKPETYQSKESDYPTDKTYYRDSAVRITYEHYREKSKNKAVGAESAPHCSFACKIVKKTLEDPVALFTAVLSYLVYLQVVWIVRQEHSTRIIERVWTPPRLQALCLVASRYDCLRVSGLFSDAVIVGIGP